MSGAQRALPRQRFFFLRHGETDWNRDQRLQGHSDIPLNPTGLAQAQKVAAVVKALPIATICASPLQRARRTAELVNLAAKPIVEIPELMECCFGVHEGSSTGAAWREAWKHGASIEGGESQEAFIDRTLTGLTKALTYPGPVLVVAHGGSIWAIERYAGVRPERVPNCGLFELRPPEKRDSWELLSHCI